MARNVTSTSDFEVTMVQPHYIGTILGAALLIHGWLQVGMNLRQDDEVEEEV